MRKTINQKTIKYLLTILVLVQVVFLYSCFNKDQVTFTVIDSGRIKVERDGLYGFVNKFGQEQIPCKYTYATSFYNKRAIVKEKDTRYYIIDIQGNKMSDEYDMLNYYHDDKVIIAVKNGSPDILLNLEGKELVQSGVYDQIGPFYDGYSSVSKGGLFGIINTKGEEIITLKYKYLDLYFLNDLMLASDGEHYGFINHKGEVKIPFIYDKATNFTSTITNVTIDGVRKVINLKGDVIWEENETEKYIRITRNYLTIKGENGYIIKNSKGEDIISNLIEDTFKVTNDFIILTDSLNRVTFYTTEGKLVKEFENSIVKVLYDILDDEFYYVIIIDDKYVYYKERLNKLQELNINNEYKFDLELPFIYDGKFVLKYNSYYGLVSESGKVIKDFLYDYIFITDEKYTVYGLNGKSYLENTFGISYIEDEDYNILLSLNYSSLSEIFYDGWA